MSRYADGLLRDRLGSVGQDAKSQALFTFKLLEPGGRCAEDCAEPPVEQGASEPLDVAFHAALERTLDEWGSPEDDEAFGGL